MRSRRASPTWKRGTRGPRRRPPPPLPAATGSIPRGFGGQWASGTPSVALATTEGVFAVIETPLPGHAGTDPVADRPPRELAGCWSLAVSTLTPHGSSDEITSTMLATIRSGPAWVSNHVAVHVLRPMSRPANHYDSQSAANLFGQRAAATTEVGGRLTAYLTKVRCSPHHPLSHHRLASI